MSPDSASVATRALAFVALFQATGTGIFLVLFGRMLSTSAAAIRRIGTIAAVVGIVFLLAHQLFEAARMADDWSGLFEADLQIIGWTSSNTVFHVGAVVGLICVAASLVRQSPGGTRGAVLGSTIALCAFLLTGHTSVHRLRWVLAPLLAVHVLIVAFWFGALVPLYLLCQKESLTVAAGVVKRFSAIAGRLVPVIAVAGLLLAIILSAADTSMLLRPYGQLLLAKLAGFGLLMFCAAYNKWRLTPAIVGGQHAALRSLRRVIAAEYAIIIAVLCVTAVLTTFYSPGMSAA